MNAVGAVLFMLIIRRPLCYSVFMPVVFQLLCIKHVKEVNCSSKLCDPPHCARSALKLLSVESKLGRVVLQLIPISRRFIQIKDEWLTFYSLVRMSIYRCSPRTNISGSISMPLWLWMKCVPGGLKQCKRCYRTGNLFPENGQLYVHRIINEFTQRDTDVITCGHGMVELITAFVVDQCFLSPRDLWPSKLESMWYRCTNICSSPPCTTQAQNVNDPADIASANLLTPLSAPIACSLSFY